MDDLYLGDDLVKTRVDYFCDGVKYYHDAEYFM